MRLNISNLLIHVKRLKFSRFRSTMLSEKALIKAILRCPVHRKNVNIFKYCNELFRQNQKHLNPAHFCKDCFSALRITLLSLYNVHDVSQQVAARWGWEQHPPSPLGFPQMECPPSCIEMDMQMITYGDCSVINCHLAY